MSTDSSASSKAMQALNASMSISEVVRPRASVPGVAPDDIAGMELKLAISSLLSWSSGYFLVGYRDCSDREIGDPNGVG